MDHESLFFEIDVVPSEKLPEADRGIGVDAAKTPEADLGLAVLSVALRDLKRGEPQALEWFEEECCDIWCGIVGLDADELRLKIQGILK